MQKSLACFTHEIQNKTSSTNSSIYRRLHWHQWRQVSRVNCESGQPKANSRTFNHENYELLAILFSQFENSTIHCAGPILPSKVGVNWKACPDSQISGHRTAHQSDVTMHCYDYYVFLLTFFTTLMVQSRHGAVGDKFSDNDLRKQSAAKSNERVPIRLMVSPRDAMFRPGNKVTVKCRVKVMARSPAIIDSLRIGFNVSITLVQYCDSGYIQQMGPRSMRAAKAIVYVT